MSHPMKSAPARLGLIAAAMTGFLVFMLVSHQSARNSGTELVMEVEGYDPRDIFLGHYAMIRTPLAMLDLAVLDGDDAFEDHAPVFATLEIGTDGLARPVAVYRQHPGQGLVAEGRVVWVGDAVHARFNIERYYASRDQALALEDMLRDQVPDGGSAQARVRVILSLPASGNLMIKGFEIDGARHIDGLW
ncbi:GDYXXLXY domain-containing protein [Maricaulis sp.]|uniref:GDYXXLXY domain-containing protein n=1 Tax=Maricaulis sp. TaxID=1486257 RepID=UPI002B2661F4|nr:GDYXXLXY domain-containing protein [Maricaulis sp.]